MISDVATKATVPRPRALAILSVSAGSVLYTLDANVVAVALPAIARDLGVSTAGAVAVVSVYNLVLAMALLPLAAIGERIGLRRMFVGGLVAYLVAAAASVVAARSFPTLLCARALQALAAGAVLSVSLALVRSLYAPSQLGRGLGLNTVASASGAALAPALGGWIVGSGPWAFVFAAGAPLAVLGLIAAAAIPPVENPTRGRFDWSGAAYCALTFGLFVAGFQLLAGQGQALFAAALLLAAALGAVGLVRHESGVAAPVLPVDLLLRPALALSVAAGFAAVLASTTLLLFLPFRLSEAGVAPAAIGAMLAPYAAAAMLIAPAAGMASDRVSPSALGTAGLAIASLAGLALAFLPDNPRFFDIAWRVALCGAGFGLFFSPNGRLVVGAAPAGRAASAASLLSTSRMLGQAVGASLTGLLLATSAGPQTPALAATALTVLAAALSALRFAVRRPADPPILAPAAGCVTASPTEEKP